jgi:beta-phosphoglucomutase-like phosphatase (HAD superfamily)
MRHEETIRALKAEKRELTAKLRAEREDDEEDEASPGRGIRELVAELRAARIDDHIWRRKNAVTVPYSIAPRSR